jgi:hypothetical protein
MSDRLQLDILASMAEQWTDIADAMLTITIGLFMRHAEMDVVDFRIDAKSVDDLLTNYTMDREYHSIYGVQYLRVTLKRKEVTSDGQSSIRNDTAGNVVDTP